MSCFYKKRNYTLLPLLDTKKTNYVRALCNKNLKKYNEL